MTRQLERPEAQDLHEGDTLVHDVHVLEQTPLTVPEDWMREHGTTAQEPRRPIRWMRWLAFLGVLAAGAGVVVIAMLGDNTETVAQPDAVMAPQIRTVDRWELGLSPPLMSVVQRTVDNWEVGLNPPAVLMTPTHYEVAQPAVEGDWDHLFLPPAVEGDWDHLFLVPAVVPEAGGFTAQIPEGQWISAAPAFHTADYWDRVTPVAPVATPEWHTADYWDRMPPDVPVAAPVIPTFADWDGPIPIEG